MTIARGRARANPLVRAAEAVPERTAYWGSVVARVAGAAFAFAYAAGQDYDRGEAASIAMGVLVLLTLVPAGPLTGWLAALGAGLLVFGGASLVHEAAGVGMLTSGVVAWLAAAAWNYHRRRDVLATVVGFFAGAALNVAVVVVVALAVEG
jgi:hypothetical protein